MHEDYSSSWQWCRERSNYHFDWQLQDHVGEWMHPVGQFQGAWQGELRHVLSHTHAVTWSTRKNYLGQHARSPMLAQELNDLRAAGADLDLELTDRVDDVSVYPTLWRMVKTFALDNCRSQIHVQRTGQMFNLHIDKLYEYADDPADVFRFAVMLEDWQPGQFYIYGTYTYTHWRAGDCHWFDWRHVPHATANASHQPRSVLQVTGRATAETRKFLEQARPDATYLV